MDTLTVGTRIYNGGDVANPSHLGTITDVKISRWGTDYQITPDADDLERTNPYWVDKVIVSPVYAGNGSTRIVTEAEYRRWRAERIAAFEASVRASK